MNVLQVRSEFFPFPKTIHLLQEQSMFHHQLINLTVCFAEVFKIQPFIRVHFTTDITLHSIKNHYIIIFFHPRFHFYNAKKIFSSVSLDTCTSASLHFQRWCSQSWLLSPAYSFFAGKMPLKGFYKALPGPGSLCPSFQIRSHGGHAPLNHLQRVLYRPSSQNR